MNNVLKYLVILLGVLLAAALGGWLVLDEPLPEGTSGPEADRLAIRMMEAVGSQHLDKSTLLAWTYPGGHHYVWDRNRNLVRVKWDDNEVLLNLDEWPKGKAYVDHREVTGDELDQLRGKAYAFFVNDSFWLLAPTKVFDKDVERKLVKQPDGNDALLMTYPKGGVTPGDSYLWILDANDLPRAFKMWVSIIPIGGVQASWEDWKTLDTGLKVATNHRIGPVSIPITDIRTGTLFREVGLPNDPFAGIE